MGLPVQCVCECVSECARLAVDVDGGIVVESKTRM